MPVVLTARPWAATAYLLSYSVVGSVLCTISLTVVVVSGALSAVWVGLPLLVGASVVLRGCAGVERWRARLMGDAIAGQYRSVLETGLFAQVKTRWSDPATLRDCGYLILMFVPLLVFDIVAVTVWLVVAGMALVPLWFWAIPHDGGHGVMLGYLPLAPDGPVIALGGQAGFGVWIGSVPTALIVGVVFGCLAVPSARMVTAVALAHAGVARSLLGPPADPLSAAKDVLAEPGPLTS